MLQISVCEYVCVCVQVRELMADTMREVVERVTGSKLETEQVLDQRADLSQHACYKAAFNHFKHNCFNWHKTEVELRRRVPSVHLKQIGFPYLESVGLFFTLRLISQSFGRIYLQLMVETY